MSMACESDCLVRCYLIAYMDICLLSIADSLPPYIVPRPFKGLLFR